ncbi:hypothetical protein [Bradymonas sediminis]|uniref:hypothetical protein n=1 Tax=Bradymonas sediminis TaxID=1548548 RepID=UPI00105DDE86|nr:hypothetical protein [Bradymonas sediminis]TDP75956.1 hypothetical protein DFR33_103305 [Bradymonas sediminis]
MRSQTNFFTLLCLFALLVIAPLGCSDDSDATNNKRPQTPETCGNGQLDEGEVCDGEQLGGETCESQGATGGQLGCKSTCLGFELTQCSAPATCGDDTIQSPEVCDGSDLAGASCESLGFDRGTLTCANNCLEVNSSGCSYEGECQPTTCADVGAQCGSIDNGCGETLNCGGCDGDLSCGGSGEENICGATCPQGCPDGFSCNTLGVCTGDSDTIAVNMPTATVELVAQVDGQAPQPSSQCGSNTSYRLGYIKLVSISNGEEEEYDIPCNGSLEVAVPKDTYRVSIQGAHSTDLLRREFQTHANLVVDSDMTITANMPTATVQLVAQLNGQAPQPSSQCSGGDAYQLADITLVSLTNGEVEEYGVDCDGTLEVKIPKDTYRVSVEGRFSSDLLRRDFQTHANLVVDADMTITANMPTATVQLVAQLNGQAPQPSSQCADDAYQLADITLTSLTNGEVKEYGVDCAGTLEVEIPKDTYRVSVEGRYSSDLLRRDFQTHANLVVDADMTITANMPTATVQLVAQLNGQAPQPSSQCADDAYQLADITLTSLTNGEVEEYGVDCDGTLEVEIPKDTYAVSIEGRSSSDLLRQEYLAIQRIELN